MEYMGADITPKEENNNKSDAHFENCRLPTPHQYHAHNHTSPTLMHSSPLMLGCVYM